VSCCAVSCCVQGFYVFIRALQLLRAHNQGVVLVGLGGASGSGKTAFSAKVRQPTPALEGGGEGDWLAGWLGGWVGRRVGWGTSSSSSSRDGSRTACLIAHRAAAEVCGQQRGTAGAVVPLMQWEPQEPRHQVVSGHHGSSRHAVRRTAGCTTASVAAV